MHQKTQQQNLLYLFFQKLSFTCAIRHVFTFQVLQNMFWDSNTRASCCSSALYLKDKAIQLNCSVVSMDPRRKKITSLLCWNKTQSTRSLLCQVSYASFCFSFQHSHNLTNFLYLWGRSVIYSWLWYLFIETIHSIFFFVSRGHLSVLLVSRWLFEGWMLITLHNFNQRNE